LTAGELGVRIEFAADPHHRQPLAGKRRFFILEQVTAGGAEREEQRREIPSFHRARRVR
jgi:hypothetical protein